MSPQVGDIHERLMREFCSMLDVTPLPGGAFALSTPFLFGDGDGLPVILEPDHDGWRFSDRGGAASHLFFDEDEMTPARWGFVRRSAESDGLNLSDTYVLTSDAYDSLPTAVDLADFIQAVARVGAVGAMERHPHEAYIRTVRTEVVRWLPDNVAAEHPWHHPADRLRTYPADLHITRYPVRGASGEIPLALFFVAGDLKASNSALAAAAYQRWPSEVVSVAAYRPGLIAPSRNKLIDYFGPENVVETPAENPSSLRDLVVRRIGSLRD